MLGWRLRRHSFGISILKIKQILGGYLSRIIMMGIIVESDKVTDGLDNINMVRLMKIILLCWELLSIFVFSIFLFLITLFLLIKLIII